MGGIFPAPVGVQDRLTTPPTAPGHGPIDGRGDQLGTDVIRNAVSQPFPRDSIPDRTQEHVTFTGCQIGDAGEPDRIEPALSKCRSIRSGGNDACGSTTVVLALNVRGEMPSTPIAAMILATVFSFTTSPRARNSAVTRGDP